ncbi:hypothetical protein, variant [Capsaspora owczarzaki ATCC 30864]|nr:hypothetical protein, variant [Capsaspora owczarzaki ATCC 30864]
MIPLSSTSQPRHLAAAAAAAAAPIGPTTTLAETMDGDTAILGTPVLGQPLTLHASAPDWSSKLSMFDALLLGADEESEFPHILPTATLEVDAGELDMLELLSSDPSGFSSDLVASLSDCLYPEDDPSDIASLLPSLNSSFTDSTSDPPSPTTTFSESERIFADLAGLDPRPSVSTNVPPPVTTSSARAVRKTKTAALQGFLKSADSDNDDADAEIEANDKRIAKRRRRSVRSRSETPDSKKTRQSTTGDDEGDLSLLKPTDLSDPDSLFEMPALPMLLTSTPTTIYELGHLVTGPNASKYWSNKQCLHRHPYPVGYHASKAHFGNLYQMRIEESPSGPVFVVQHGEEEWRGTNPTTPWTQACLRSNSPGCRVSGPLLFGFSDPFVIQCIQHMPGYRQSCASIGR